MKRILYFVMFLLTLEPKVSGQSLMPDVLWSKGGHAGQVEAVALSPDESIVASAGEDYSIKLWRFADAALLRTLMGHSNTPTSIAFSSDGQLLVSGSYDRTIRIWQASDGHLLRAWTEGAAGVTSIALSPDNSLIAAGSGTPGYPSPFDGAVRIWNAANGTLVRTLTNSVAQVSCVVFSPDGQLISAACVNGAVFVWRVSDGKLQWLNAGGIGGWSGKVAFSPDGQRLAYGAGSGWSYVGVRRVSDGVPLWWTNAHSDKVRGLAFSSDGKLLVSVGSRNDYGAGVETNYPTIILWNPTNGARLGIVPTPSASVSSVVLAHDGTNLLTGEGISLGANSTYLRLWQTNGILARDWNGHSGSVTALAISTNGNTLASGGSGDRIVRLWSGTDGTLLQTLTGHAGAVTAIAFSPDGSQVAYGDDWSSSLIRLFRVSDGGLEWSQSVYPGTVSGVAFSPDSPLLAVGEGYSYSPLITLRRAVDGAVSQTISSLTNALVALAFLPSDQVASLTQDRAVKFWQTNGVLVRSFNVNTGLACAGFSTDGTTLAAGYTNQQIQLIRTADGVVQRTLLGHANRVTKVGFSADGEMLCSAAQDELLLWRISDGRLLRRYTTEILSPASLALSPRGDSFALGRTDATFLVARKPEFFLPLTQPDSTSLLMKFSGVSGTVYAVQTSTDAQNWFWWTNVLCSGPAVSLSAPISGSANRFYRLNR